MLGSHQMQSTLKLVLVYSKDVFHLGNSFLELNYNLRLRCDLDKLRRFTPLILVTIAPLSENLPLFVQILNFALGV